MTQLQAGQSAPRWSLLWLLVLSGILVYYNSIHGQFTFDDDAAIRINDAVHQLWPIGPILAQNRPVAKLSFAINYAIGGYNPFGFHLVNIAIHLLGALALYGIVRRTLLLPRLAERFAAAADPLALAISLLWLVHPLQTQAVTYIVQREESLAGLFYLLAMYAFVRFAHSAGRQRLGWIAAATLCLHLGMASKQIVVTAPLVFLLYDYCFISAGPLEPLRRRGWVYLLLLSSYASLLLSHGLTGVASTEAASGGLNVPGLSPWRYLLSQPAAIVHYLYQSFWPRTLCIDWVWPRYAQPGDFLRPMIILGPLALLGLWGLARRQWYGFLLAFFFITLSPSSSIMPLADVAVEHRMYLPLAAVIALSVILVYLLLQGAGRRWSFWASRQGACASLLLLAAALPLGLRTVVRNMDYHSNIALWESVIRVRERNARAWQNLATTLYDSGQIDRSIASFRRAIDLQPDFADAYTNLGAKCQELGRLDEALELLAKAVNIKPDDATCQYNYAIALLEANRLDEADEHLRHALRLRPRFAAAHNNLGILFQRRGQPEQAAQHFQQALSIAPDLAQAHNNLAGVLLEAGREQEALAHYQQAANLEPERNTYLKNGAAALARLGQYGQATAWLQKALQIQGDDAAAAMMLATALHLNEQDQAAAGVYEEVLRHAPHWPQAMMQLAWLRAVSPNAAVRNAEQALRLAQAASAAAGGRQPLYLDTLAAAQAAAGRFDQACASATSAVAYAQEQGDQAGAEVFQQHLALFQQGRPLRVAGPSVNPWRSRAARGTALDAAPGPGTTTQP